jgi:hypothetical protein
LGAKTGFSSRAFLSAHDPKDIGLGGVGMRLGVSLFLYLSSLGFLESRGVFFGEC